MEEKERTYMSVNSKRTNEPEFKMSFKLKVHFVQAPVKAFSISLFCLADIGIIFYKRFGPETPWVFCCNFQY